LSTTNPAWPDQGTNPDRRCGKSATNRLSYGMARYYVTYSPSCRSQDSVVGIAISYGLDDREVGVRVPVELRIFSSPDRPDRLWGPLNLLSNGYSWLFPRG
jgi:hypothetical protein